MFNLLVLVLGGLCTVYASFKAARRAGAYFIRHGGWVATASALSALVVILAVPEGPTQPLWVEILGFLIIIPSGILGGYIAARIQPAAA